MNTDRRQILTDAIINSEINNDYGYYAAAGALLYLR